MYSCPRVGRRMLFSIRASGAFISPHSRTATLHSSGNSDRARMRVRASSPRFVSCVAVAARPPGAVWARAQAHMEFIERQGGGVWLAADFVEREQPVMTIEARVLER